MLLVTGDLSLVPGKQDYCTALLLLSCQRAAGVLDKLMLSPQCNVHEDYDGEVGRSMSRRLLSWRDLTQRKLPTEFRMSHSLLAAGQNLMRLKLGYRSPSAEDLDRDTRGEPGGAKRVVSDGTSERTGSHRGVASGKVALPMNLPQLDLDIQTVISWHVVHVVLATVDKGYLRGSRKGMMDRMSAPDSRPVMLFWFSPKWRRALSRPL